MTSVQAFLDLGFVDEGKSLTLDRKLVSPEALAILEKHVKKTDEAKMDRLRAAWLSVLTLELSTQAPGTIIHIPPDDPRLTKVHGADLDYGSLSQAECARIESALRDRPEFSTVSLRLLPCHVEARLIEVAGST